MNPKPAISTQGRTEARAMAVLIVALLPAIGSNACAQARLGTLFYSPPERVALAVARNGDQPSEIQEVRSSLAVSGLVKRSPQKGTLWINGQAIPEGQAVPPASAPTIMATGVIVDGKQLRVGETLDLTSGERADFIPEGSVKVKQAK